MNGSSVITGVSPVGRVSYPSVFVPNSFQGGEPKYELTLIFDEGTDLSELEAMARQAIEKKWGNRLPRKLRNPIRDGNEKDDAAYHGKKFIRFSSKRKPRVVGPDPNVDLEDDGTFYPGCYARVSYTAFCYDVSGNAGAGFGLTAVQKVRDGEPLGGIGRLPSDVFGTVESTEDASSYF